MSTAIVWFRQDLRLSDNPALYHAASEHDHIIPVYILDDETPGQWAMGGASRWWLHHSLSSLTNSLHQHHCQLILRKGDASTLLPAIMKEFNADAIYWNRLYEPHHIARDTSLKEALSDTAHSYSGYVLFEPWDVKTNEGNPYQVFTPFWKQCVKQADIGDPYDVPKLSMAKGRFSSDDLDDWPLLPTAPDWAAGLREHWQPGEEAALERFSSFLDNAITNYKDQRNFPAAEGTSRMSPHLHFGEISLRRIWHACQHKKQQEGASSAAAKQIECYLSEIGWREFSYHLLYHFPYFPEAPHRKNFENFPWKQDAQALKRWQKGQTGYPIIDAGMRELWETGIMHNRIRMVVASFLVKNLLIPWQEGAAWFWDTLVDADLASNSASWQWVAGSGADAAPYFRIFNPILQSKKFDQEAEYIRRFVPEIKDLPNRHIHAPHEAPASVLEEANITLGKTYPNPIVDLGKSRDLALKAYQGIKNN